MLRTLIQDISYLSFFTNYDLQLVRTNEMMDYHKGLVEYHIVDFDKIKLVKTLYSKSTVEHHLDRLNYITNESPPFINDYVSPLMVTVPFSSKFNKFISENCSEYYRDPDILIEKTKEYRENAKKENVEQIEKFIKSQKEESKNPNIVNNNMIKEEKNIKAVIKEEKKETKETNKSIKLNPKHISTKPEQKQKQELSTIEEQKHSKNQAEANKQLELCMKSFAETRKKVNFII